MTNNFSINNGTVVDNCDLNIVKYKQQLEDRDLQEMINGLERFIDNRNSRTWREISEYADKVVLGMVIIKQLRKFRDKYGRLSERIWELRDKSFVGKRRKALIKEQEELTKQAQALTVDYDLADDLNASDIWYHVRAIEGDKLLEGRTRAQYVDSRVIRAKLMLKPDWKTISFDDLVKYVDDK